MKFTILVLVAILSTVFCATLDNSAPFKLRKATGQSKQLFGSIGQPRNYCPLCDSSVYEYCYQKLFHDSCCCNGQFGAQGSYQCLQADCTYLHANSCKEHALIAECCCDD